MQNLAYADLKSVYTILAEILLQLQYTDEVVKYFREELLHILHIAIDINGISFAKDYDQHILNCVVLAKVVALHPDAER